MHYEEDKADYDYEPIIEFADDSEDITQDELEYYKYDPYKEYKNQEIRSLRD